MDNFKLDVRKDSLHEIVNAAIKEAVSEYLEKQDKESAANEEKLRREGKPANALEAYTMATKRSDNAEVMMQLEGIDLMFSDQEVIPMPIKDYREYMKERKKEAKDKAKTDKLK